jgi:DNA-binding transcriptional MerR regulator
MQVSELARRSGTTATAIRFYEAEGILPAAERGDNGYRRYDENDLCRVRVITALRSLGLDLREAGRLAGMCADGRCDAMAIDLLPQIVARRSEVAAARAELDHLDAQLANAERALRMEEPIITSCTEEGRTDAAHDQADAD